MRLIFLRADIEGQFGLLLVLFENMEPADDIGSQGGRPGEQQRSCQMGEIRLSTMPGLRPETRSGISLMRRL